MKNIHKWVKDDITINGFGDSTTYLHCEHCGKAKVIDYDRISTDDGLDNTFKTYTQK